MSKSLIGGPAIRQEERGRREEGKGERDVCVYVSVRENFMSVWPETREAPAHKNALYPRRLAFSVSSPHPLSQFSSLLHLWLRRPAAALWCCGLVCCCQRSRQPYFLNGRVTDVNKAGWPSTRLHLSIVPLLLCMQKDKSVKRWGQVHLLKLCAVNVKYHQQYI